MNRDGILNALLAALGHIDLHPRMLEELISIIVGSGYEQKFITLFLTRLKLLSHLGINAVMQKEFENIGDGLFSMHLSGRDFNIRILYSFLPNQDPTLLLCFYERGNKRKTDYTNYLAPAKARLAERMEASGYGK